LTPFAYHTPKQKQVFFKQEKANSLLQTDTSNGSRDQAYYGDHEGIEKHSRHLMSKVRRKPGKKYDEYVSVSRFCKVPDLPEWDGQEHWICLPVDNYFFSTASFKFGSDNYFSYLDGYNFFRVNYFFSDYNLISQADNYFMYPDSYSFRPRRSFFLRID
jgi:hypothetical protein